MTEIFAQSQRVTPVSLILDASGSMQNRADPSDPNAPPKITEMVRGLNAGIQYLLGHPMLQNSAYISLTTIGEGRIQVDFTPVKQLVLPQLIPNGGTPMGAAINQCLDGLNDFLHAQNTQGKLPTKPTLAIVTDGEPNCEPSRYLEDALDRIRQLVAARRIFVIACGVSEEDVKRLHQLQIANDVVPIAKVGWEEAFRIVSASAASLAQGQQPLPAAGGQP